MLSPSYLITIYTYNIYLYILRVLELSIAFAFDLCTFPTVFACEFLSFFSKHRQVHKIISLDNAQSLNSKRRIIYALSAGLTVVN